MWKNPIFGLHSYFAFCNLTFSHIPRSIIILSQFCFHSYFRRSQGIQNILCENGTVVGNIHMFAVVRRQSTWITHKAGDSIHCPFEETSMTIFHSFKYSLSLPDVKEMLHPYQTKVTFKNRLIYLSIRPLVWFVLCIPIESGPFHQATFRMQWKPRFTVIPLLSSIWVPCDSRSYRPTNIFASLTCASFQQFQSTFSFSKCKYNYKWHKTHCSSVHCVPSK